MLAHQRADDGLRGGVEAGQGLVQQPDLRSLPQQPGERGAFLLAGRKVAHRHFEQVAKAKPITAAFLREEAQPVDLRPERQRAAQRQVGIEPGAFIQQAQSAFARVPSPA